MVKVQSYVMLILLNVTMKPLNVRKKNKETIECDKSIAYCDNKTIKCEKTNKRIIDCYNFIPKKLFY